MYNSLSQRPFNPLHSTGYLSIPPENIKEIMVRGYGKKKMTYNGLVKCFDEIAAIYFYE